ncbi:MAG: amino acid permease [Gemmatimonadales bacterium]
MTDRLPRVVGPATTVLFVVGWIIGSGIFRLPAEVAARTGSAEVTMLWWALGAVFALAGAFCYAELGTRLPRSGGEFVYLNAGFGPGLAFLFGWCNLVFAGPASIAAVSRTFADYGATLVPMTEWARRGVAASLILVHTLIAIRSTRAGARVMSIATTGKILAIGVVVLAAFLLPVQVAPLADVSRAAPTATELALGFTAIIFAYKGFQSIALLGGEVRDPQRSLPLGLLGGTGLVAIAYLLLNGAFLRVLGFEGVRASTAVAADAMHGVLGPNGARFVAVLVLTATFGTVSAQMLGFPRLAFAMAEERLFFARFASLSRWQTPWQAVLLVGAMSAGLVLSGSYASLIRLAVLAIYPLTAVTVYCTARLRQRQGPPSWSMPLYPLPLLIFVASVVVVSAFSLFGDPRSFALSAGATLLGIPVYLVWIRFFRGPAPAAID